MRTDDKDQAQQVRLSEGMRLIFDQDSSVTPRSTRPSSRSSNRDSSESSSDSSRSSSVSRKSRRRCARHRSSDSSSSSSSRSRAVSRPLPRCHRTLYPSRCRHRHHSRCFSPSPKDNRAVNEENDTVTRTSPTRRPITFNINKAVAKASSSPTSHRPESKVTSRADSVADRKPYGLWIPVKSVSPKKR